MVVQLTFKFFANLDHNHHELELEASNKNDLRYSTLDNLRYFHLRHPKIKEIHAGIHVEMSALFKI